MYLWSSRCKLVTSYIIEKTNEYNENIVLRDRITIPVMRVNLLLYFIQIEYIKRTGRFMFVDKFYAWTSGPVIPAVYEYFTNIGQVNNIKMTDFIVDYSALSKVMKETIDSVLEQTYNMDALDLSILSRVKDGPWYKKYDLLDVGHRQVIAKKMMIHYYGDKEIFDGINCKKRVLKNRKN